MEKIEKMEKTCWSCLYGHQEEDALVCNMEGITIKREKGWIEKMIAQATKCDRFKDFCGCCSHAYDD